MKKIPLTQGKHALVDDADYERLNCYKWQASPERYSFYARRSIRVGKDRSRSESMHRVVLGLQSSDKREVDHRDGNGLNNQRANLRVCTAAQNRQFRRKHKVGSSRYKGVCFHRLAHKWESYISVNGKQIYLGLFNSEIKAAQTYDKATLKHHGEFALTNEMLGLL